MAVENSKLSEIFFSRKTHCIVNCLSVKFEIAYKRKMLLVKIESAKF